MTQTEADIRALIDNQLREKGWDDSQIVRKGARPAAALCARQNLEISP